jgi:hypothetical protein
MADDEAGQTEPVEPFVVAPPPPKAPPSKTPLWIVLGVVGGLIVGFIVGVAVSSDTDSQTASSTTKPGQVSSNTSRSTVPSTTTTAASYTPVPTDFQIGIVETERACFGTAGCSIEYRIDVTYIGVQAMKPGSSYTVMYDVLGGDDPKTDNFEITGSQFTSSTARISTPPNPTLTATATRVLEN